jgi:hypothetical protein
MKNDGAESFFSRNASRLPNFTPGFGAWLCVQRFLALLMLIALAPLLAFLFILVKIDSRGPFLYVQERPGRFGKPFNAYKIRSMSVGADRNPQLAHAVTSDTPEVTRIGRYLRDFKLDEVPQLWNIVRAVAAGAPGKVHSGFPATSSDAARHDQSRANLY